MSDKVWAMGFFEHPSTNNASEAGWPEIESRDSLSRREILHSVQDDQSTALLFEKPKKDLFLKDLNSYFL